MEYHRGTVGTYQRWADLAGDENYTWLNVLPYFKKSTTLTPHDYSKRDVKNATVFFDPTVFDNSLDGPGQVSWRGNWLTLPELGLLSPYSRLVCLLAIWVSAAALFLLLVPG